MAEEVIISLNRSVGLPWQKKEAEEFVKALRNQLFDK
jgi:hypothetical protein